MEQGIWITFLFLALGVIGWGINKYIDHLESSRNDERAAMEAMKENWKYEPDRWSEYVKRLEGKE